MKQHDVIFTLTCPKGHGVDAGPEEAERLVGTVCQVCWGPLFVKGVRT